jgi:hypothetical protein
MSVGGYFWPAAGFYWHPCTLQTTLQGEGSVVYTTDPSKYPSGSKMSRGACLTGELPHILCRLVTEHHWGLMVFQWWSVVFHAEGDLGNTTLGTPGATPHPPSVHHRPPNRTLLGHHTSKIGYPSTIGTPITLVILLAKGDPAIIRICGGGPLSIRALVWMQSYRPGEIMEMGV